MAIIGLLLFLLSATVAGGILIDNRGVAASGHLFGYAFNGISESGLFASGLVLGVLATLAISLFFAGLASGGKRRARQRIEARRVKTERQELGRRADTQTEQAEALRQERDRLAAELERERQAHLDSGTRAG